jgi:hypothetical protein
VIDPITRNRSLSRKTVRSRQGDTPKGNDVESNKYFEVPGRGPNHCLRSNGTPRAYFSTRQEAEAFAGNESNSAYDGDVAHLCVKCDLYHLSKPSWLEPILTQADYQMLEAAGIETARAFCCDVCGCVQSEGEEFFILRSGSLRCSKCVKA